MNLSYCLLRRKLTTTILIVASLAAFATLGDKSAKKKSLTKKSFLSYKPSYNYKTFSLKTGYNYRGKTIFTLDKSEGKYIQLNNVVTYQKGNTTYILPLKKKLVLQKIKFNPAQ